MRVMLCVAVLFLGVLAVSCSRKEKAPSALDAWMLEEKRLRVLSTTAMIDDLVGHIGGEYVAHLSLISGEVDPHSYELVKGDEEKLGHAQVVFYNGLGLEHGASLRYHLQQHSAAFSLGEGVRKRAPERILVDRGQVDPHIWMDISLWQEAVDPIAQYLSEKDPVHAEAYQNNAASLKQRMRSVHEEIRAKMLAVDAPKRFLITSHDAFNYFAKAYLAEPGEVEWKRRFEAPEGLAPDGQLSSLDIQRMIDHVCAHRIFVLFPESNVNRDSLKKIVSACREKGVAVTLSTQVLYGDAMGGEGYLAMVQHNAEALLEAWKSYDK